MKIPTLLGMALLIFAVGLGLLIFYNEKGIQENEKRHVKPERIQVVNITDSQASILWETYNPTEGKIVFGTSQSPTNEANDPRNQNNNNKFTTHFVNLNNLNPETTYYFLIKSNNMTFPDNPQSFKTARKLSETPPQENKPLRGSVLNLNLNPIDEALVFLKLDNAQEIATFTSTAGNFIIPLKDLRTRDLNTHFTITPNTPATLVIKKGNLTSEAKLNLPLPNDQLLPPITMGQNISLQDLIEQSMLKTPATEQPLEPQNRYDLNQDNKINTLDLALIQKNVGQKIDQRSTEEIKRSDLTGDGLVDQKDVDLLTLNL